MATPRSFLRTWIVTLVGLALLVVALNLLVDPYDVFGTPRIRGISLLKPGPKNHALLAKTYQEARVHPVTILIGSSSTHIGTDAAAPQWPAPMRPVYNYGIPRGYATSTSLSTLREALTAGGVRYAVVALDFQNFFVPEQPSSGMTEDDRRYHTLPDGTPNPYRSLQVADDMFLSLATMGALIDSLKTIGGQENPGLLNLAPNGSSTESDFVDAARSDGMHDLFAQKDDFELDREQGLKTVMARWQGELPNLDIVRNIVALARAHHVKLTLVLTPHHADALEVYWREGLWPRVEQLKVELAAIAAQGEDDVAFWDFMDYSGFSTEAIPAAGDRHTQTHWFWEPTHFKKQLGAIMIQRMFGEGAPEFGARLTPENVADRNAQVRSQRRARVCSDMEAPLLTSITTPLPDGCSQVPVPHGPT
jgi:hypothetical protein